VLPRAVAHPEKDAIVTAASNRTDRGQLGKLRPAARSDGGRASRVNIGTKNGPPNGRACTLADPLTEPIKPLPPVIMCREPRVYLCNQIAAG